MSEKGPAPNAFLTRRAHNGPGALARGLVWVCAGAWFAWAAPAGAWGPEGHALAAGIAERRLSPETRDTLRREFNIIRLAEVANWADHIKRLRKETRPWHYTNIPAGERRYLRPRDCPTGDCVTEKIPEFARVVADRSAPRKQRTEALKFLVHFMADLHQPMHLGHPEDRGGNEIRVRLRGVETNLHALWDHDLILRGGRSLVQYAAELERAVSPAQARAWLEGTVVGWAQESRNLALDFGYALETDGQGELTPAYITRARAVTERRLQQAGVRLADWLNRNLK